MSTQKQSLEIAAKAKLINLVKAIEPVVEKILTDFTSQEINYVLDNFKQHLSYDLGRDFEQHRGKHLKESPFDELLND
mgnify:CR=1 FL=1